MANFEPKQFGKYVLMEKLAVGGMAEIYKAKTYGAEGFEKLLAIKRILPHAAADKEFINMLIDEAKLSVVLSHANIVQVFDLGKVGEDYFISMEFIHGVNFRDILYRLREKNKRMPTDLAVYIASEVCKGLDYAHRKTDANNQPLDLVHRDISPQNILISYEGEVKIVDFGIAKAAMNISHTMAGILKGKIAYMSPEQALGKTIDHRTDIFSLGILLYEALTGQKLYTGESQFEVLKKIRTTRIDVAKLPDSIPEPVKPILAKALAYKVEDRYASASDMQIAITKYLYATFTGFSPRKLAMFVKGSFQDEINREKGLEEGEKILEAQTSSVNPLQGGTQENIVHRETTPMHPSPFAKSITISETYAPPRPRRFPINTILSVLVILGLGFTAWKFFLAPKPITPEKMSGTIQVKSDPSGANIFLNGEATSYKTPAILENLKLHQDYVVSVTLEKFGKQEKRVNLVRVDPLTLEMTLTKNLGVLNVISEPPGAAILVDDVATGKITPATLEELALNQEYRVTLSKPDFQDFEQPMTLISATPQKLMASLKPIVVDLKGSLLLETQPTGAKIFLDNQDTGKVTPSKLEDLNVGQTFSIRFEKENFDGLEKQIILKDTQPLSIIETLTQKKMASLEPIPKGATPPKIEKPVSIQKLPEVKKEPPPPPVEKPRPTMGEGSIKVTSNPSHADVFVNGEHQGATPLTIKARAGSLRVLVTKGSDTLPCKKTISVEVGETATLNCLLGTLYGKVEINTTPPGAEVYLNGKKLGGKTPLTVTKIKRDQEHTLRLFVNGYKSWERSFHLEDRESKSFNVDLER